MEKNKCKIIGRMKNNKGITLLALAVTIVILLILTSIGIKLALGNNGIIGEAKNAKELAEIDEEKGIVKRATTVSLIKSKGSKVEQDTLEKALNDETGEGKTEVNDVGDVFEVVFVDSNRYYEVDEEGNISDVNKITKDDWAGDITKGGRCDGSEEKPYEISCIEDLVAFSNMSNGGGITLENGVAVSVKNTNTFEGKYVVLTRNLNFKSKYSYDDYTRTDFGDINGEDTDGNMLMTEMTTGTGFKPIGDDGGHFFEGNFNGNENKIENMLIVEENNNKDTGFFGKTRNNSIIENLTVSGNINSKWHTGGIVGEIPNGNSTTIRNCTNKVNVTGVNAVGGILGYGGATETAKVIIENCNNYGDITITEGSWGYTGAGGIAGSGITEIINCNNYGKISGNRRMGGIVAYTDGKIINCVNNGEVNCGTTSSEAGGIVGHNPRKLMIRNCINTGNVTGAGGKGGLIAVSRTGNSTVEGTLSIENCINIGNITSTNGPSGGIIGLQQTIVAKNYIYIYNTLNLGKVEGTQVGSAIGWIETIKNTEAKTEFKNVYCEGKAIGTGTLTSGEATQKTASEMKSQSFIDLLNSNIGTNTDWKRWKLGKDGYPTFEE